MSIAGCVVLLIIAGAVAIAWRGAPARDKVKSDDASSIAVARDRPSPVAEEAWCDAIEGLGEGSVVCLDASLRLTAAGAAARAELQDIHGGCHMLDLIPRDAATPLLGLAAEVRRKGFAMREVPWGGAVRRIGAAPLEGERLLLCMRPIAVLLLMLALSMAGCGGIAAEVISSGEPRQGQQLAAPHEILAAWLEKEAGIRLRAQRASEAEELASLVAFFEGEEAAASLRDRVARERTRAARELEMLAAEAREAGESLASGEARREVPR